MGLFDCFKSREEREREQRRERRRNERKVEQDIEKFDDAIAKLTEERTKVWNQARELLKSGRKAEAQRTLLFYKKYDIAINKLEKQKVFLKSQALQVSTAGNVNTTLNDIKTMAADHDIDPDKLAESLDDVEMIAEDILDSDKIMNKAEPNATRKWVRKPASFARYSRSSPIKPPNIAATKMRIIKSNVISIPISFNQ